MLHQVCFALRVHSKLQLVLGDRQQFLCIAWLIKRYNPVLFAQPRNKDSRGASLPGLQWPKQSRLHYVLISREPSVHSRHKLIPSICFQGRCLHLSYCVPDHRLDNISV